MDGNNIDRIEVDYKRQFQYLSIPVKIGYKLNFGKKLYIQPSIGLISSYLLKAETTLENRSFDAVKAYKKFDILALADLMIGCNLTSNIALTGSYRHHFKLGEKENMTNFNSPISTNRSNFTLGLNFKLH